MTPIVNYENARLDLKRKIIEKIEFKFITVHKKQSHLFY